MAESRVTPHLRDASRLDALSDWGTVAEPLTGASHTSGRLLYRDACGYPECGVWVCTPQEWPCEVTRDEFCHFLAGRCTYVHDSGEVIAIQPDTRAFFATGWRGVCTVHEAVRKVYMIR